MTDRQELMLRITGYAGKMSVSSGEKITFHVHSEYNESYQADIVRLVHGDTNPEGPGLKEEVIPTAANGMYVGKNQPIHAGSYILVPSSPVLDLDSFTLCGFIYPTTPLTDVHGEIVGNQALISKWDENEQTGYELFINSNGELALRIGRGDGEVEEFSTNKPLFRKVWYKVWATYDAASGEVRVSQQPHVTHTNGGHGMSMLYPADDTADRIEATSRSKGPGANDCPLLMAASTEKSHSGRFICGGHFVELTSPWELPVHTNKYNGKIDRPRVARCALSDAEIELLLNSTDADMLSNELRKSVVAMWDFSANIGRNAASTLVVDTGPCLLHGHCVNMPVRAVPGHNWTSDYMSFTQAPQEYSAIHFHDESVDDARWESSFELTIPDNLRSGVYAARLRIDGIESAEHEDYIPFFVRPPKGKPSAKIAMVVPTYSYLAYANDNLSMNSVLCELLIGRVPLLQPGDLLLNKQRGYGLGTYATYRDGWGVNISSYLRPILNMRPKFIHVLSPSLWQMNADLHIIDWFDHMGYDLDVITDHDIEREGVELLKQYQVVLTGHHPEYSSEQTMNAYHDYQMQGGRWLYLAANGFYWAVVPHPSNPALMEVRKGDNGSRAWTINPGEYCNAFDGKHGGLWRVRGRVMSKQLGVVFTSFGLTYSSYYRRAPDSELPECSWIMNGVDKDEPIGNFGLIGDGAAGLELDRYDLELGTPHRAFLLAHSEGHNDIFVSVSEESTYHSRGYFSAGTGDNNPKTRADMVYYKTPNDGAVFSVGSMTFTGSLSHNNYDNNVSQIMRNVVDGFLKEGPLP